MLLYFIQYPSRYPSYGVSQRLIVASDNLIKSKPECRKDGEKDMKRNYSIYSKGGVPQVYLKPKREGCNGCTGMSHGTTSGGGPARSVTMKQVWRPKRVFLSST